MMEIPPPYKPLNLPGTVPVASPVITGSWFHRTSAVIPLTLYRGAPRIDPTCTWIPSLHLESLTETMKVICAFADWKHIHWAVVSRISVQYAERSRAVDKSDLMFHTSFVYVQENMPEPDSREMLGSMILAATKG